MLHSNQAIQSMLLIVKYRKLAPVMNIMDFCLPKILYPFVTRILRQRILQVIEQKKDSNQFHTENLIGFLAGGLQYFLDSWDVLQYTIRFANYLEVYGRI